MVSKSKKHKNAKIRRENCRKDQDEAINHMIDNQQEWTKKDKIKLYLSTTLFVVFVLAIIAWFIYILFSS